MNQPLKFYIIITGHNCAQYVAACIKSIKQQTYQNYEALFIDDGSTDATGKTITDNLPNDPRFKKAIYTENKFAAFRRYEAIKSLNIDDEDVLVIVGLDDMLLPDCLSVVKNQYDRGMWVTCGQWKNQNGVLCKMPLDYPVSIQRTRDYRKDKYRAIAPNTFKKKLWNKIPESDYQLEGKWLEICTETGFMFSCLEMCGQSRIGIIRQPIYIYRQGLPNNTQKKYGQVYKDSIRDIIMGQRKKDLYEQENVPGENISSVVKKKPNSKIKLTPIQQCYISESLQWFKRGFMDRYGLKDYTDNNAPCVFVGVYGADNAMKIRMHKGFKIVMFCGSDIAHAPRLSNDGNISGYLSDMHIYEKRIRELLPVKKYLTIAMKSFEDFKPVPLGDKIYFYGRSEKDSWTRLFRKDLIDKVIKHFGEERVLIGYQGNSIEKMREEYYAKSFINLNFTKEVGFTTCLEMAHMGRKSISNYPAYFCVPYKSEDDIIRMIEAEEKRIGLVRNEISEAANEYYQNSDDWMFTEYWK